MAKKTWLKDETNEQVIIPRTLVEAVQDANGNALSDILEEAVNVAEDSEVIQLPNTNPAMIFSDLDYSEEEQLTGKRWPDGRPVYEKTFVINGNFSSGQDRIVEHNIENLDLSHIIITGSINHSNGTTTISRTWDTRTLITTEVNSTKLLVYTSGAFTGQNAIIVMQYAKTTDTPQSPVKPVNKEQHVYDDTEKIVGTWFGKPLYEKTCVFDSETFSIEDLQCEKAFIHEGYVDGSGDYNGQAIPCNCSTRSGYVICRITDDFKIIRVQREAFTIGTKYITIRYTKTTD